MELRNYQAACVDTLAHQFLIEDKQRLLVVLPTAAGKTVCFAQLPQYFSGPVLSLAHRTELVQQAASKFLTINPDLHVAIEQAEARARLDAGVIVASIQTLARPKRRQRFKNVGFALVIVDEAHHCAQGNTYHEVLKDLGCFSPGGPKLLGVTATPYRSGGESLAEFFEQVAFEKPLLEMIEEGWVSPLSAYQVHTKTSLDKVGTRAGDFKEGELSEAVNNELRNLDIVRAYQKLCSDRRSTLVFAVDVAHAKSLVVAFRAADISAELVLGVTDSTERAGILRRFVQGDFKVLVNVGIATEGVDIPPIDAIILARPTKSSLLITQMIGRGLRLSPETGKQNALVVDLVDNTSRHKLMTAATILGLPANVNAKGKDLRTVKKKLKEFTDEFPGFDIASVPEISEEWIETQRQRMKDLMSRSSTEVRATAISLFGAKDPTLQKASPLAWIKTFDGTLKLRIPPPKEGGNSEWAEVKKDASDHWTIALPDGQPFTTYGPFDSRETALRAADQRIQQVYRDRMTLMRGKAKWHGEPATEKQLILIRKLGGKTTDGMTKGAARDAIDQLMAVDTTINAPPTAKQQWRLRRMGVDPSRMTRHQASVAIARAR